jgi:hypothetical protein
MIPSIPELGFTEYAILALIQAVLLCLSSFEHSSVSAGSWGPFKTKKPHLDALKRAGTWAFLGILVTLGLGITSQVLQNGLVELPLTLIPIIFISLWARYYQRGSQMVELKVIQEEADKYYIALIIQVIETNEKNQKYLGVKDLYIECVSELGKKPDQWLVITSLFKNNRLLLSAAGIGSLLDAFALSYERYEDVLAQLKTTNRIYLDSDHLYRLGPDKKQLPPAR